MLFLSVDVINYSPPLRLADAEGAVSFLPREPPTQFIDPFRRLGQLQCRRQRDQQVKVVGGSPGGQQQDVLLACDPANIQPQPGWIAYEIGAVFGAEDAMHEVAAV